MNNLYIDEFFSKIRNREAILDRFIEKIPDINEQKRRAPYKGYTVLMIACLLGTSELVKKILKRTDIDVNLRSTVTGTTALDMAVYSLDKNIITAITSANNIDVNMRDNNGNTPLMNIIVFKHKRIPEIIDIFLNLRNIDININSQFAY